MLAILFVGLAALLLVFVWAIFHGEHHYEPIDEDTNQNLDETKEVLKDRSKWFF